ncbi:MAG: DUF2090 domain-containing protein, partial [Gluconacetobacter diazotrophicus]|nr:DUF2090 domain-containing protein [Gluconacetobacter diazotrophicus]
GAFAVSRLLCAPEIPSFAELEFFLREGSPYRALRHDPELNRLHWASAVRPSQPVPARAEHPDGTGGVLALACDHRVQLEQVADSVGAGFDRIAPFKLLAVEAAVRVADGRNGFGMFLDGRHGREALFAASRAGLWVARPIERTGSRPLDFEGGPDGNASGSLGAALVEWPIEQVVKVLCFTHPDDDEALILRQERELLRAQDACRRQNRTLLVEIIAGRHGVLATDTVPRIVRRLYDVGLRPDWWKLEPQRDAAAWRAVSAVIAERDPWCRGVVMLGLEAPAAELVEAFGAVAGVDAVKGFAIGRTIFIDPARDWMAGRITDAEAVDRMADRFAGLVEAWERANSGRPAAAA